MGYTSPVVSIFQLIKLKKNTTSATYFQIICFGLKVGLEVEFTRI